MAGGTLLPGRVDNHVLSRYLSDFDPFFDCFLRFRREWPNIISYIQRVSPSEYGQIPPLTVAGGYTVKGEHGTRNTANEEALYALERLGFICDLSIVPGERVSFRFRDLNTRAWLRDVGSVLELYTYKACLDSGIFHDVINELAILRDRFGGKGAKAVIVTTEPCHAAARHRAAQLGIAVIDLEELKTGQLVHRLKVIMKAE